MYKQYRWPRIRHGPLERPQFFQSYPVPPGKTFNVNSFLGKKDVHKGKYLVPIESYPAFLKAYQGALEDGYMLFCTENYQQQVYKYFVELDWEWDTPLELVMEVTEQLLPLAQEVAGQFYRLPHIPNAVHSIRTPYKVHINFPEVLTTELLANKCRDRLLEVCRERLGRYPVDWERLIDFPHGSLRLLGSRKTTHIDRDPPWVVDKAYHPATLHQGKWKPGGVTLSVMRRTSIFPSQQEVAAFERSEMYLDMIFEDVSSYKHKLEERQKRREEQRQAGGPAPEPPLPPGSRHNPLRVRLVVQEDGQVKLDVRIKSKWRSKEQRFRAATEDAPAAAEGATGHGEVPAAASEAAQDAAAAAAAGAAGAAGTAGAADAHARASPVLEAAGSSALPHAGLAAGAAPGSAEAGAAAAAGVGGAVPGGQGEQGHAELPHPHGDGVLAGDLVGGGGAAAGAGQAAGAGGPEGAEGADAVALAATQAGRG